MSDVYRRHARLTAEERTPAATSPSGDASFAADGVSESAGHIFYGWFWLEKKANRGEDALPLVLRSSESDYFLAVFDGLGGSGSTEYEVGDGVTRTGAYLAARCARGATKKFVEDLGTVQRSGRSPDLRLRKYLHRRLQRALSLERRRLPEVPTILRSSLIRILPTTIAAIHCRVEAERSATRTEVIWAGDSRAYRLTPQCGLQQLTADDTQRGDDALASLSNDAPLSNLVNASTSFEVRSHVVEQSYPHILFVATDGCFGYVHTPWHFEALLLETLLGSRTPSDWAKTLGMRLGKVAGDDASLAFIAAGWNDFSLLASSFRPRYERVRRELVEPVDLATERLRTADRARTDAGRAFEEAQTLRTQEIRRLWETYSVIYTSNLVGIDQTRQSADLNPEATSA